MFVGNLVVMLSGILVGMLSKQNVEELGYAAQTVKVEFFHVPAGIVQLSAKSLTPTRQAVRRQWKPAA
jgi:ABC-type transport system involved in cytochrome c biogenesis permease subunit